MRSADQTVVCADFGSTFTKVTVVDLATGELLATAASPTTSSTDVMDGLDRARTIAELPMSQISEAQVLACSSAGGGLRIGVVGYERAITAEAGHRVALSAGGRVVHVSAGQMSTSDVGHLIDDDPDVILLVGGTDGGNADVLIQNSRALARAGLGIPVVVAGNRQAQDQVCRILTRSGVSVRRCANVLPRIGVLDPIPAREAIRQVFIDHVIGGKHLSDRVDLSTFVSAATPDAVLAGVELLADGFEDVAGVGDVVVVDVGGATTDVYSVLTPDAEQAELDNDAVATMWRSRSVEGDLGVRWNAVGVVEAARHEGLVDDLSMERLMSEAERRSADPGYLPDDDRGRDVDRRLMTLAATIALRRHARPQVSGPVRHPGKDLSRVRLVVGSGGVLRHTAPAEATAVVHAALTDPAGGWRTPDHAPVTVDSAYVLAAAGLLSSLAPRCATHLLQRALVARLR